MTNDVLTAGELELIRAVRLHPAWNGGDADDLTINEIFEDASQQAGGMVRAAYLVADDERYVDLVEFARDTGRNLAVIHTVAPINIVRRIGMSKHTKEPWTMDFTNGIIGSDGRYIVRHCIPVNSPKSDEEVEANIARIVATVNATAGISTSDLEKGALEELVNVARNTLEDIRMFLSGEWDGSEDGWQATAEGLQFALEPFDGIPVDGKE